MKKALIAVIAVIMLFSIVAQAEDLTLDDIMGALQYLSEDELNQLIDAANEEFNDRLDRNGEYDTGKQRASGEHDPAPARFFTSYGLTVMDENQVEEIYGYVYSGSDPFTSWFPNESYCVFNYSSYSRLPMIVFKYDNTLYLVVEMAALHGSGTMSAETVSYIYAAFCTEFSFDILMASNDGHNIYLCTENPNVYDELDSFLQAQNDSSVSTLYDDIDVFLYNAVYNFEW